MPVHVAFYVKIYDKVPNDFDEKKKLNLMKIKNVLLGLGVSKQYVTVGNLLKFASKPEQPGLSSSICLEVM